MLVKRHGRNVYFSLKDSSKIHGYRFPTAHDTAYARWKITKVKTIKEAIEIVKNYKGASINS